MKTAKTQNAKGILFFLVFTLIFSITKAQTEMPTKFVNLGLISELAYVKLTAENRLAPYLEDTTITEQSKKELIKKYVALKTIYDQFLLQLMTDNIRYNNVKNFTAIDDGLSGSSISTLNATNYTGKVRSYITNLKVANDSLIAFMNFIPTRKSGSSLEISLKLQIESFFPATASVEELTGVLSFISGTIKDIRETRGKKVDAINKILNDLRLSAIQDLAKPKEKEKKDEKKDDKKGAN